MTRKLKVTQLGMRPFTQYAADLAQDMSKYARVLEAAGKLFLQASSSYPAEWADGFIDYTAQYKKQADWVQTRSRLIDGLAADLRSARSESDLLPALEQIGISQYDSKMLRSVLTGLGKSIQSKVYFTGGWREDATMKRLSDQFKRLQKQEDQLLPAMLDNATRLIRMVGNPSMGRAEYAGAAPVAVRPLFDDAKRINRDVVAIVSRLPVASGFRNTWNALLVDLTAAIDLSDPKLIATRLRRVRKQLQQAIALLQDYVADYPQLNLLVRRVMAFDSRLAIMLKKLKLG